jgi:hypothetical protein
LGGSLLRKFSRLESTQITCSSPVWKTRLWQSHATAGYPPEDAPHDQPASSEAEDEDRSFSICARCAPSDALIIADYIPGGSFRQVSEALRWRNRLQVVFLAIPERIDHLKR